MIQHKEHTVAAAEMIFLALEMLAALHGYGEWMS